MVGAGTNGGEGRASANVGESARKLATASATYLGANHGSLSGIGMGKFHPGDGVPGFCPRILGVDGADVFARAAELSPGFDVPEVSCPRAPLGIGDRPMA